MRRIWCAFCLMPLLVSAQTPLELTTVDGGERFRQVSPGTYEIAAGGGISLLATPSGAVPAEATVLEFEVFSVGGVPRFAALPGPPFEAKTARWLPPIGHSETWTPWHASLVPAGNPLPAGWRQLRLDLPLPKDATLRVRGLRLRAPVASDEAPAQVGDSVALHALLDASLRGRPPCLISSVHATRSTIKIRGQLVPTVHGLQLAEWPIEFSADDPRRFEFFHPLPATADGGFEVELPRIRPRDGLNHDRLFSKWQIVVRGDGGAPVPRSHARYADTIDCRSPELPRARLKSKKGLGGWSADRPPQGELARLGISAVTVNVMVHTVISLKPGTDTEPFPWQGRTYHARRGALERFDATFLEAARHGAMVSAILLIPNPARGGDATVKQLGHPAAAREGTFAMPDVTSTDGLALYGAALNLMAERWSRPDGKHGRVHHWIVHNEVDAGAVWTNAGKQTDLTYMDLYHRSMRMVDLIARQYDPHARAFISLTHHWTKTNPQWHPPRRLLEILAAMTRTEGEFPWGIAYHPYPQNLFVPRCWEDQQASFSFDTQKITPRNLEVLDAFVKQPWMKHCGTEIRPVHLSENGFNSKDYSEEQLRDQAAGMAWAWKKIQPLSSIEVWHYHNWIDNRHEGGLRIGLRKFPDEPGDPLGPKPVWHLYQALATSGEDQACAPYLPVVGARSWPEILHRAPIPANSQEPRAPR